MCCKLFVDGNLAEAIGRLAEVALGERKRIRIKDLDKQENAVACMLQLSPKLDDVILDQRLINFEPARGWVEC